MTPSKYFLHRNMIREDRDLKVIGGRCFLPSRVIVDVVFHSFCTTLVGENIMMASRHQILFVDGVVDPKPQANPSRSQYTQHNLSPNIVLQDLTGYDVDSKLFKK